jgi:hypothetical protein
VQRFQNDLLSWSLGAHLSCGHHIPPGFWWSTGPTQATLDNTLTWISEWSDQPIADDLVQHGDFGRGTAKKKKKKEGGSSRLLRQEREQMEHQIRCWLCHNTLKTIEEKGSSFDEESCCTGDWLKQPITSTV